jgi:ethanolaminephosphotransferase
MVGQVLGAMIVTPIGFALGRLFNRMRKGGPISDEGLTNIANYKYVPGCYTPLDVLLGPACTASTELLPMWVAPNLVTTIGSFFVLILVLTHTYFSPNFIEEVPNWVFVSNGLLLTAYYWLDWMDGKQARRTGSSSPLGQLFDHGVDCLCIYGQFTLVMQILGPYCLTNRWNVAGLTLTQTGFFLAQLVEYYYHFLPHTIAGVFGTSEINFGLSLVNIIFAFIDRSFMSTVVNVPFAGAFSVGAIGITGSVIMLSLAIFGPLIAIPKPEDRVGVWSAACMMFAINICTIFVWPDAVIANNVRLMATASWLVSCYTTCQVIVYSLAKQPFDRLQWPMLAYCFAAIGARYFGLEDATHLLLALCCILLTVLCEWVRAAMKQITTKLGIRRFHIDAPEKAK